VLQWLAADIGKDVQSTPKPVTTRDFSTATNKLFSVAVQEQGAVSGRQPAMRSVGRLPARHSRRFHQMICPANDPRREQTCPTFTTLLGEF